MLNINKISIVSCAATMFVLSNCYGRVTKEEEVRIPCGKPQTQIKWKSYSAKNGRVKLTTKGIYIKKEDKTTAHWGLRHGGTAVTAVCVVKGKDGKPIVKKDKDMFDDVDIFAEDSSSDVLPGLECEKGEILSVVFGEPLGEKEGDYEYVATKTSIWDDKQATVKIEGEGQQKEEQKEPAR